MSVNIACSSEPGMCVGLDEVHVWLIAVRIIAIADGRAHSGVEFVRDLAISLSAADYIPHLVALDGLVHSVSDGTVDVEDQPVEGIGARDREGLVRSA